MDHGHVKSFGPHSNPDEKAFSSSVPAIEVALERRPYAFKKCKYFLRSFALVEMTLNIIETKQKSAMSYSKNAV